MLPTYYMEVWVGFFYYNKSFFDQWYLYVPFIINPID